MDSSRASVVGASDDSAASAPSDSAIAPDDVVRAYYDAIDARDFARAYALWSDSGRASGKSLSEFSRGFDATASVTATIGAPGRIEGAAGSRYVEVPVELEARQRNGAVDRYRGTYTLRRAVVTGATVAQRTWHLYSAKLARID